ncbi:hypothetical protein NMG60_11036650 [Bertholletia excelsa]
MDLSSQEGEMPIPINSSYGGGHMIHHDPAPHNHIIPTSAPLHHQVPPNNGPIEDHVPYKKMIRYRECLKNHAAAMGGNATDGCGEFMPSGEEGTLEALTCSACNCHRNFHRKEVEGEQLQLQLPSSCDCSFLHRGGSGRKVIMGNHRGILGNEALVYPTGAGTLIPSRGPPQPQFMAYSVGHHLPSESDEQVENARPVPHQMVKKRFRTKFTQEQKEKMLNFAEKVGWKIQKQEESVVQQFCQEIGVKRRVLKVWMHNNKHNLAKKNPPTDAQNNQI